MYLLQRTDGAYVTRGASPHYYTHNLDWAKVFPTREAAERNRCVDNERVVAMGELIRVSAL